MCPPIQWKLMNSLPSFLPLGMAAQIFNFSLHMKNSKSLRKKKEENWHSTILAHSSSVLCYLESWIMKCWLPQQLSNELGIQQTSFSSFFFFLLLAYLALLYALCRTFGLLKLLYHSCDWKSVSFFFFLPSKWKLQIISRRSTWSIFPNEVEILTSWLKSTN